MGLGLRTDISQSDGCRTVVLCSWTFRVILKTLKIRIFSDFPNYYKLTNDIFLTLSCLDEKGLGIGPWLTKGCCPELGKTWLTVQWWPSQASDRGLGTPPTQLAEC